MSKKKSNGPPPTAPGCRPTPPPAPPAIHHAASLVDNHKEIVVDSLTPKYVEDVIDNMLQEYTLEQTLATETLECMKGEEYSLTYRRLESKRLKLIAGFNALFDLKARLIKAEIL